MGIVVAIVVVLVLAAAGAWLVWGDRLGEKWHPQWAAELGRRLWEAGGRLAKRFGGRVDERARLQRKFGREYDRVLAFHGEDHAAVERELGQRERDRRALSINPVSRADRARLAQAWQTAQANFIDDPGSAARQAQRLVGEALTTRGYPAGDPERQLALASVDHAPTLSEFRDGHDLLQRSNTGAPDVDGTEQVRQAMLRFRVFFDDLTGERRAVPAVEAPAVPADREVAA